MIDASDFSSTPYRDLANAIVVQAARDYQSAERRHDQQEMRFITKFFHSQWFTELTSVDPDYIMRRL